MLSLCLGAFVVCGWPLPPFGEALRGFTGSVIDVMHSVVWMVKYVFAAVEIVFSVLGYAASIPNSVIPFAAFRRLGPDVQSRDDNPAIFLASVWRCPTSLFPVLPWAVGGCADCSLYVSDYQAR